MEHLGHLAATLSSLGSIRTEVGEGVLGREGAAESRLPYPQLDWSWLS